MLIGKSKDYYGAMSINCEGIYSAGESIEAVKADTYEAIESFKRNLPEDRWPKQIKGKQSRSFSCVCTAWLIIWTVPRTI